MALVALLTECVDRNLGCAGCNTGGRPVALLTECVDRNQPNAENSLDHSESHSLRSAWIEISSWLIAWSVANPSHSLRSAWIEIRWRVWMLPRDLVALLTECVDRNVWADAGKEGCVKVALLTECVDRNRHSAGKRVNSYLSHSLRSAWIEIAY